MQIISNCYFKMSIMLLLSYAYLNTSVIYDYKLLFSIILIIIIVFKKTLAKIFIRFFQKNENTYNEKNLPKNMLFYRCPSKPNIQNNNEDKPRPLALIFAWFLARNRHLVKYKELWLKRGFDVLIVKNTPKDILFPPIGSQVIAKNVIKVISSVRPQYKEIVVHGFSIGCYVFGEVLVHLYKMPYEGHHPLISSIKGLVMDSGMATTDGPHGLSKVVAKDNPKMQLLVEKSISLYLKMFHNISAKHHEYSQQLVLNPPLKYPALIFYSKDDEITKFETTEQLVQKSVQMGNEVTMKCWDESGHVLHYKYHQKEYEQELDAFLDHAKLQYIKL